jgi:hypothetical protein
MSDADGADDRRGAIRQAEEISESPPRENAKKEQQRRRQREYTARKRKATKQQLEELVRLQAVVIPDSAL